MHRLGGQREIRQTKTNTVGSHVVMGSEKYNRLPWWSSRKESSCQGRGHGVQSLLRDDLTCHGATRPLRRSYWASALQREGSPSRHNQRNPTHSSEDPEQPKAANKLVAYYNKDEADALSQGTN